MLGINEANLNYPKCGSQLEIIQAKESSPSSKIIEVAISITMQTGFSNKDEIQKRNQRAMQGPPTFN